MSSRNRRVVKYDVIGLVSAYFDKVIRYLKLGASLLAVSYDKDSGAVEPIFKP
jgi:hypothetical protein